MAVNTATDISISQAPLMLPVLPCFVEPPINLTGRIFTTGTGLSASIFYFVNITTGIWSALYFTITECGDDDTSVDAFST